MFNYYIFLFVCFIVFLIYIIVSIQKHELTYKGKIYTPTPEHLLSRQVFGGSTTTGHDQAGMKKSFAKRDKVVTHIRPV
jgi:hypothetical protein